MHAEGRALISAASHSLEHELSAGRRRCRRKDSAGVAMTALPHDAFGIAVDDAEGVSFRVPLNR
jgi:hypothetical protein